MARILIAALALATALTTGSPATSKSVLGDWGFDRSAMDLKVRPGNDFFSYVNGTWMRNTEMPTDRSVIGPSPDIGYRAGERVRSLLDDVVASKPDAASSKGRVAALYGAFLDVGKAEALGATPLRGDLEEIRTARDRSDLAGLMGRGVSGFHASVFDLDVAADPENPRIYALRLSQGGLGLPNRDYYVEPQFAAALGAYRAYVGRVLTLVGWPDAEAQADAVVAFETRVAAASWPAVDVRNPKLNSRPKTLAELAALAPGFQWDRFLAAAGVGGLGRVIVTTDTSLPRIADIYAETPIPVLKAWQAFRTADAAAPYLDHGFVDANFDFRGRVLAGTTTPPPRWRTGVRLLNTALGSAVGELYVAKFFSPTTKAAADELIANVVKALRQRIAELTWMEPATKAEALLKLSKENVEVGYPAHWRDYRGLELRSDDLYGDVIRTRAFEWQRQVALIGRAWEASNWHSWPQEPIAYGDNRDLVFPAAMFQAPYFDEDADPAINYGGMGAVIGHELTHLFDDRGRQEDEEGRLRNWWTTADGTRFDERAARVRLQYSAFEPLPGLHVRGDVTVGENIADLGGVAIALAAYRNSLGGKPAPVIDGFTGDQRVFLGWAQGWRQKQQPDALRRQIASDVHSPPTARVNGVLRNLDEWYEAFGVQPGDALYLTPAERARIW